MTKTALYRFFDADGKLLYVGITERFGQRWTSHAQKKPWWDEVHSQTAEWYPERPLAAEAEKTAIRTEGPKYNIIHKPKPVKVKVKPAREEPAERRERPLALSIPGYMATKEVAELLSVTPATVRRYLHKKDLPKPDGRAGQSPLWKESTILAWEKERASASWNRRK